MIPGYLFDSKNNGLRRMPRFLSQIRAPCIRTVVVVVQEQWARYYVDKYPLGEIAGALSRNPAFGGLERVIVRFHEQENEIVEANVIYIISWAFEAFFRTGKLQIEWFDEYKWVCRSRITLNHVAHVHKFWFTAAGVRYLYQ